MAFKPRKLRHRINIEEKVNVRNNDTGSIREAWVLFAENVPAEIVPVSVREFIASQGMQSAVTARIVIRHRPGLKAEMRIIHNGKIYNPQGWLADPDSGQSYLTAPCTEGVNLG